MRHSDRPERRSPLRGRCPPNLIDRRPSLCAALQDRSKDAELQEANVKALQKVEDLYAKQTAAGPYFLVRRTGRRRTTFHWVL